MNAYHKPLISCFVFVSLFTLNGIVVADNADDIRLRVQKVGKLNIAGQAAAETPASPATTETPADAPTTEVAVQTPPAQTSADEPAAEVAVETPPTQTAVEAPVAEAAPATTEAAATVASAASGDTNTDVAALYQTSCFACHGTGVLEAPKLGDKAAWAPRIAQGNDILVEHAIKGFNAMPPRGASTLDDEKLKQLVAYMVESAQ